MPGAWLRIPLTARSPGFAFPTTAPYFLVRVCLTVSLGRSGKGCVMGSGASPQRVGEDTPGGMRAAPAAPEAAFQRARWPCCGRGEPAAQVGQLGPRRQRPGEDPATDKGPTCSARCHPEGRGQRRETVSESQGRGSPNEAHGTRLPQPLSPESLHDGWFYPADPPPACKPLAAHRRLFCDHTEWTGTPRVPALPPPQENSIQSSLPSLLILPRPAVER